MASFRNLMDRLGELASAPSRVSAAASEKIAALIDQQFAAGNDAYGKPWAPLKPATLAKGRTPPPLTDSGDMRSSVSVKPLPGSGIEVTMIVPYSGFHQTGTRNMVPREPLPDQSELPKSWQEAISSSFSKALKRQ